jgi:hypothetical protein
METIAPSRSPESRGQESRNGYHFTTKVSVHIILAPHIIHSEEKSGPRTCIVPVHLADPILLSSPGTTDTDDIGFGDQPGGTPDRIGGSWQLRRISSVVVNGDSANVETLFQRDTHKGIILSTPLQLTLEKGSQNTITVGGLWNGFDYKGADLDRIVVYPPEN